MLKTTKYNVIFNIRRHTNEVRTVTAVDGDPIPASLKLCTELSWHNRAAGNQSQSNSSFCAGKCSFTLRKTLLHSRPPLKQYTVTLYTLILTRSEPSNDICLTRRTTLSRHFNICNPFTDFFKGFVNISFMSFPP